MDEAARAASGNGSRDARHAACAHQPVVPVRTVERKPDREGATVVHRRWTVVAVAWWTPRRVALALCNSRLGGRYRCAICRRATASVTRGQDAVVSSADPLAIVQLPASLPLSASARIELTARILMNAEEMTVEKRVIDRMVWFV